MIDIQIDQYGLDDTKLFDYDHIVLHPGLTVLVGCNGSGKTTLMKNITSSAKTEKIVAKIFTCCETHKITDMLIGYIGTSDSVEIGINMLSSSEGEQIAIGLQIAFNWLWSNCKKDDVDKIILLLDSLDSGIDIPTINMIVDVLHSAINIAKTDFNVDLYVIISANSFALVKNQKCIDVKTGKEIAFKTWKQYANFCIKSDAYKQKRYDKPKK